ncbi:MAG TPA: hypothetical protein VGM92_13265 [Candidatus Kapabacteria bacterium]
MRKLIAILFLFVVTPAFAQTGGSPPDTTGTGQLRPRSMGSYIVGVFPSPAAENVPITVQTYNRMTEVLSVTVYDNAGHPLLDLIPKQSVPGGLQNLMIGARALPSGAYHVQLITYTASDAPDVVDEARFIVAH